MIDTALLTWATRIAVSPVKLLCFFWLIVCGVYCQF